MKEHLPELGKMGKEEARGLWAPFDPNLHNGRNKDKGAAGVWG